MKDRILPIGTIVKLKNDTNNFMVAGYDSKGLPESEHIYDYSGFLHPMGLSGSLDVYRFDQEQIEDIIALGYQDQEQMAFVTSYLGNKKNDK